MPIFEKGLWRSLDHKNAGKILRDFPAFQKLGLGALDCGKNSAQIYQIGENLIESFKQYVNILAFLLPAQTSISSFFVVNLIRRRHRMQW